MQQKAQAAIGHSVGRQVEEGRISRGLGRIREQRQSISALKGDK
jgi:hypothetical protein